MCIVQKNIFQSPNYDSIKCKQVEHHENRIILNAANKTIIHYTPESVVVPIADSTGPGPAEVPAIISAL